MGLLFCCVGAGIYLLGDNVGWWGAQIDTSEYSDDFVYYVEYRIGGGEVEAANHSISLWRQDISQITDAEELEDTKKDYSQYTLVTAELDSGEDYDNVDEDKYAYKCLLNGTNLVPYWFTPTNDLPLDAEGANNHLYASIMASDCALAMVSHDEKSTAFDSNTSGVYYDEWDVQYAFLDGAEGTGEVNSSVGYMPYHDFENYEWNCIILRLGLNTTATAAMCDWDDTLIEDDSDLVVESVSGNYLYYAIKVGLFGAGSFKIDLGSGHGTTFTCVNASIGYGTAASATYWDTYTS